MSTAITHVQPGSIAQRLGLVAGDKLVSIAGEPIIDQIDYQALTAQERFDMMVYYFKRRISLKKSYSFYL